MNEELAPLLPEEEYLGSTYTPARANLFKEMEQNARALIEAALQKEEIEWGYPPLNFSRREVAERNEWFEACFDLTERELIDAHNACVRQLTKLRGWRKRHTRNEVYRDYVRLHSMLTVAKGLTTGWY